jgi:hypothetical protein
VSLEALRRGIAVDLSACFAMEYTLCYHFLQQHDFYEGIRALLVDKDKSPHWQPATLSDISVNQVAAYFKKISHLNLT